MEQEQFASIMPIICSDLIAMIVSRQGVSEEDAIKKLYSSKLYAALEHEDTKVWHYSSDMLFTLLERETEAGSLQFPDV